MNKPPEMAHVPPNWQIYFRVPDINAAVERIKANGGKILNGPMEVPGGDWIVNAMDPQGAASRCTRRNRNSPSGSALTTLPGSTTGQEVSALRPQAPTTVGGSMTASARRSSSAIRSSRVGKSSSSAVAMRC